MPKSAVTAWLDRARAGCAVAFDDGCPGAAAAGVLFDAATDSAGALPAAWAGALTLATVMADAVDADRRIGVTSLPVLGPVSATTETEPETAFGRLIHPGPSGDTDDTDDAKPGPSSSGALPLECPGTA